MNNIAHIRQHYGRSGEALAAILRVHHTSIERLESGQFDPATAALIGAEIAARVAAHVAAHGYPTPQK